MLATQRNPQDNMCTVLYLLGWPDCRKRRGVGQGRKRRSKVERKGGLVRGWLLDRYERMKKILHSVLQSSSQSNPCDQRNKTNRINRIDELSIATSYGMGQKDHTCQLFHSHKPLYEYCTFVPSYWYHVQHRQFGSRVYPGGGVTESQQQLHSSYTQDIKCCRRRLPEESSRLAQVQRAPGRIA